MSGYDAPVICLLLASLVERASNLTYGNFQLICLNDDLFRQGNFL